MKNITVRKIVLYSIGLFSALMLLIGLSFSMIYCNLDPEVESALEEFGTKIKLYENGFDMLSFEFSKFVRDFFIGITQDSSYVEFNEVLFGITSLLMLIMSILSIGLIVLAFFNFNEKKGEKTLKIIFIISIILTVVHAIFPIIFCTEMNSYIVKYADRMDIEGIDIKIKTVAFIPFILQVVSLIAYIVCSKKITVEKVLVKQQAEEKTVVVKENAQKAQVQVEDVLSFELSVIELLKEYKKLHEENIVTDAEYMEKRVKIMNSANEKVKRLSSVMSKACFDDVVKAEKTVVQVLREYKKLAESQIISDADYITKKVVLLSCVIN